MTRSSLILTLCLWAACAAAQDDSSGEALTVEQLLRQAQQADARGDGRAAERLCTEALQRQPDAAGGYYWRGRARFRLGQFHKSVADFDRYVELRPDAASRQWERGIACYYAGKFQEGAEQFALYQTYHDNDVENSVWRYLCMARMPDEGVQKARAAMLPIRDDRRVPMMQVYELYRGQLQPDDVLQATAAGDPPAEVLSGRQFYARLYLGLYFEAQGDAKQARHYIQLAAEKHEQDARQGRINAFMWSVADVHWKRLKPSGEQRRP